MEAPKIFSEKEFEKEMNLRAATLIVSYLFKPILVTGDFAHYIEIANECEKALYREGDHIFDLQGLKNVAKKYNGEMIMTEGEHLRWQGIQLTNIIEVHRGKNENEIRTTCILAYEPDEIVL